MPTLVIIVRPIILYPLLFPIVIIYHCCTELYMENTISLQNAPGFTFSFKKMFFCPNETYTFSFCFWHTVFSQQINWQSLRTNYPRCFRITTKKSQNNHKPFAIAMLFFLLKKPCDSMRSGALNKNDTCSLKIGGLFMEMSFLFRCCIVNYHNFKIKNLNVLNVLCISLIRNKVIKMAKYIIQ